MVAIWKRPIWEPNKDRKEKAKEKTKGNGNGPRCRDLTIYGHDLPHTEVREGRTTLNKGEDGSNGVGGVSSLLRKVPGFSDCVFLTLGSHRKKKKKKKKKKS